MPAPPLDKEPRQKDLVLVNPLAGGGRGAKELVRLHQFARSNGWDTEFLVTANAADLVEKALSAASAGQQRIFVLGGDGTFQLAINALGAPSPVSLGMIPAGGGNDLATALCLPSDAVAAAKMLLDAEAVSIDVVRVRTSDGRERLYCGGGGLGLDAEASRLASEVYRHIAGRLRYVLAAIRAWHTRSPIDVQVQFAADEEPTIYRSALLVSVLNTPSFGAGIRLAPGARLDDGELDLVVLENLNFWEVLALLPALLFRGEVRTRRIHRRRIRRVRIEAGQPCAFHGDGEILGTTPVDIEIVPQAIRVLRP